MKPIKCPVIIAVIAFGLCSSLFAQEPHEYPRISLSGPGGSKAPKTRDEYVILVVEGSKLSYEANPIENTEVVEYVNKLLQVKNVSYIGVYTREGTKYGDVVRALDLLRGTKAKKSA